MPARPITANIPSPSDAARPRRFRDMVSAVLRRVELWIERRRQRHMLFELTDDQLRDIGLSRSEAFREASTPFWRP